LLSITANLQSSADFFDVAVGLGVPKLKKKTEDIFRDVDGDGGEEVEFVFCLKETREQCRR